MHQRRRRAMTLIVASILTGGLAVLTMGVLAPSAIASVVSPVVPVPPQLTSSTAGTYVSLTPARILDTAAGTGAPKAPVAAGGTVRVSVLGRGGVPSTGVAAVAINLTVASATAGGYLTAYPDGSARPATSTLNFPAGVIVANLAYLRVPADGAIDLYNGSAGTIRAVADVEGYFTGGDAVTPGSYVPLTPLRIMDTGSGLGVPKAPIQANTFLNLAVRGVGGAGGVPATGASAVVLNVTVASATTAGFLSVSPGGAGHTGDPEVSFVPGHSTAGLVVVPLAAAGDISFWNDSKGTARVIADVEGYVVKGAAYAPGAFSSFYAERLIDQTPGLFSAPTPIAAHATTTLQVTGPFNGTLPADGVGAAVLEVTVMTETAGGYLTAYPTASARPTTSDLNFSANSSVTNLMAVNVDQSGRVSIYNGSSGTIRLRVDAEGYFIQPRSITLGWTPTVIDLPRGNPTAVSCVSASTCVAVDAYGNAIAERSGVWAHPERVGLAGLLSVSCPTATFCAAVDPLELSTFDGVKWATPVRIETAIGAVFTSVSCASATFCVAVDALGQATTWGGTTWGPLTAVDPHGLTSVACPAAGTCFATDGIGGVAALAAGSWHVTSGVLDGSEAYQISCPTTTWCEAISAQRSATYAGGSWSASTALGITAPAQELQLSCGSPTFCAIAAQRSGGLWVAVNGHTWGARATSHLQTNSDLDCLAPSTCIEIGTTVFDGEPDSAATFDGAVWSAPTAVDVQDGGGIERVTCPTTTFCLATDSLYLITMHGTTWSWPQPLPAGTDGFGLVCTSITFCAMGGTAAGTVATYDGTTWSAPRKISTKLVVGLSCASSTFCLAIDQAGDDFTFNGSAWKAGPAAPEALGNLVSCSAATFCMDVALNQGHDTEDAMIFDGTHWGAPHSLPFDAIYTQGVSCGAPSSCTVLSESGEAFQYDGAWEPELAFDESSGSAGNVTCLSASTCLAVDPRGYAVSLVDGWGGVPALIDSYYGNMAQISCVSAAFCVAADQQGLAFVGRAP